MLNGKTEKTFRRRPMSVENEPIIPIHVRYIEAQSAEIVKNRKITAPFPQRIKKSKGEPCEKPFTSLQNHVEESSPRPVENIGSHDSPVMSPTIGSPTNTITPSKFQYDPNLSYAEKVAHEMIVTEKIYLDNLRQIIDGFLEPVTNNRGLDVSKEDINDLFINVEEIYNFNWVLLKEMEKCHYDLVKLAECFVAKQIGFDVYTKYCTHYPRSMEVLLEWTQREDTANFIKSQQEALGHTLPLCSFLLKPVQRILKYHLLLGNIAKHYKQSNDEEGYEIIQKALSAMTNVAKHINDMKRKHEDAVHLQEIQSVLMDYEGPNLTSYGSLELEDTFRLHGTKTGRYLFLFEKALLITKRRNDGTFSWKATVMYSNMMLADSIFREPLTFQVIPFDDRKICYTFIARDLETKQIWLLELKRRLLDSYTAEVPMKAKQILLGNGREECEKENAEPESHRKISGTTRKGANQQRTQSSKDTTSPGNKLNKPVENERRKSKDAEETLEDKSPKSIDVIKSPLRRKLRVFKKRKFSSSRELAKQARRISWSSDENNDDSYVENEALRPNEDLQNEGVTVTDNRGNKDTKEVDSKRQQYDVEEKQTDKNDNVVSIESLLRDGTTLVSVSGEVGHSSGRVKLRGGTGEVLPAKKRWLAKGNRDRYKSMPIGEFHMDAEARETRLRSQSMSKLYEKRAQEDLLCNPSLVKELQTKYGLVDLRKNAANIRTRRLGSYEDQLTSTERDLRTNNAPDDAMSKMVGDTSVKQTMKCVSAAFSDISPNFTPEKTPASSSEDLTEDLTEDVTWEEDEGEDYDREADRFWDDNDEQQEKKRDQNRVKPEHELSTCQRTDNEIGKVWDNGKVGGVSNENEDVSVSDSQSNDDKNSTLPSEHSSCVDVLSDFWDEEGNSSLLLTNFDGSYQNVFCLKRAFSEENLISTSKSAFHESVMDSNSRASSAVASKSCSHFGQKLPIVRSKSAECSSHHWSKICPFTFSVTPKKKIVIKDTLWDTINEDSEVNHIEKTALIKDGRPVRRRKKRSSDQRKSRSAKNYFNERQEKSKAIQKKPVLCAYASLNLGDYRKMKNKMPSAHQGVIESSSKTYHGCERDLHDVSSITKVEVALKKKSTDSKKEKDLVRVDANVSQVSKSINYLCIEAFPADEHMNESEKTKREAEKVRKVNRMSNVGRLSQYFSSCRPEAHNGRPKSLEPNRYDSSIKKRVEELMRRERNSQELAVSGEKNLGKDERCSVQHVKDRISEFHRSSEGKRFGSKAKIEQHSSLFRTVPKVKRLKNRLEENSLSDSSHVEHVNQGDEAELGSQLQTRLCIKDRIDELQHPSEPEHDSRSSSKKIDNTFDKELRSVGRIKDRIERLREGTKKEIDSERDITISDGNEPTRCVKSPSQHEEVRTVVIKRGWVQQFIQRIETGS